ncbi:MAG: YihY/virulence factor BrkB family protein [Actinobacteria bacterium]|nr:MAG: YihY/virulence factor BrkB family protein [Actinomycetota bacterium]
MSTATTDTRKRSRNGAPPRGPARLTRAEWLDVFKRAGKRFLADDCMGLSQQVAFSALLAFLPTVILLIGLLGLFGTGAFNSLEHFVGSVAPHGVISMIDFAKKDAAQNKSGSAIAFVVGVFGALWAASGAMGAVVKAVNRAYDRVETRPFLQLRLTSLVLVVATGIVLAGIFLLIIFGGDLGDAIARRTPLDGGFRLFWNIARWPIAFVAVLFFFSLVYYLAPNKEQRSWKWLTAGSLVGSLMWLALSGLFALYTSFSSSYDRTYGSLAGGIVLLLWLNYSAWAILFGAELNAELDRQADIHAAGGPQAGLTKRVR